MTEGIIAWSGQLELIDAAWSLKAGRTVDFNIIQGAGKPLELHPFAGFVKRRGNRVGTRFHLVAVHPGSPEPIYDGQVMLMGGGSPLGKPMTIKFWLEAEGDSHPFDGCWPRAAERDGQEFQAVFVELGSDEQPIDQTQRDLLENATRPRPHATSRYAAMLCGHPVFHQYLAENVDVDGKGQTPEFWAGSGFAAQWMRTECEVDSRAEFDADIEAAARFHSRVREPYAEWCQEHGYDDPR